MEKLVRDGIPDRIRAKGEKPQVRVADAAERRTLLARKLVEEASEFAAGPCLEELADVLEVMRALLDEHGLTMGDVEHAAETKRRERGGFGAGYVLTL